MLEQRDNRLALQNATVMREMAQDSREATVYTQQDSTDMRIIATVTLVFLPGTFTAVRTSVTCPKTILANYPPLGTF